MNRRYGRGLAVGVLAVIGAAVAGGGAAVAARLNGGGPSVAADPAGTSFVSSHRDGDGPRGHGPSAAKPGCGDDLAAAASYLGLTSAQLRTQLESGKTLAQIAGATAGKSVAGLVDALVAAEQKELDAAVSAGRLTRAQADTLAAGLRQRVTDSVNGSWESRGHGARGWRGESRNHPAPASSTANGGTNA